MSQNTIIIQPDPVDQMLPNNGKLPLYSDDYHVTDRLKPLTSDRPKKHRYIACRYIWRRVSRQPRTRKLQRAY